jgi:hypothetical protein
MVVPPHFVEMLQWICPVAEPDRSLLFSTPFGRERMIITWVLSSWLGQITKKTSRFCFLAHPLTLALVALFGKSALAQQKPAARGGAEVGAIEIRLDMSADFSASARALSIELYRGAMDYLIPLNKAGGVSGRQVEITAYEDKYQPDLQLQNTLKLMADDVFALFSYVGMPTMIRTCASWRAHPTGHCHIAGRDARPI